MANKKQRLKNRKTAQQLDRSVRARQLCPECGEVVGESGGHWITTRHQTLEDIITAEHTGVPLNPDDFGFWCCAKFYEPDTTGPNGEVIPGRRKQEHINPCFTAEGMMSQAMGMLMAGMLLVDKDSKTEIVKNPDPNGFFQEIPVNTDPQVEEAIAEIQREGEAQSPEAKALLERMQQNLLKLIGNTDQPSIERATTLVAGVFPVISNAKARRWHESPAFREMINKPIPLLLSVAHETPAEQYLRSQQNLFPLGIDAPASLGETENSHGPSAEKFCQDFIAALPGLGAGDLPRRQ